MNVYESDKGLVAVTMVAKEAQSMERELKYLMELMRKDHALYNYTNTNNLYVGVSKLLLQLKMEGKVA
jgi:hypothetical protein